MGKRKTVLAAMLFVSGCTLTDRAGPDPFAGAIAASTNALCGFIPAAADVATLFEITGAAKVKQIAALICDAVEKRKKDAVAEANAREDFAEGQGPIKKLPAGTELTVVIEGKAVSGLTTR